MTDYVRVDVQGRVAAEDDGGRRRLATRQGRYYLAPTSPDLMLLLRAPPVGGQATAPRVVLAGDPAGFPLAELVGFIHQLRKTGVLRVTTPGGERAILFKDGEVRGAASDDPADRLGEIAVRFGMIDRATLEEMLRAQVAPTQVGKMLVERGVLQAHDLWKCIQHQVAEIFHNIVLAHEGAFVLVDQEIQDRGAALALNTQGLLMDSIRRIDEMAEFRKRLPSDRGYLVPARQPGPELEAQERQVFEMCTGNRTVAQIATLAKLSEFEAMKIAYHLVEGGYASVSTTAVAMAGSGGEARAVGLDQVAAAFNTIFREIRDAVARQGLANEFLTAANAAIAGQSEGARKLLEGHGFKSDGTVDARRLVTNARAAHLDARAAHAALSEQMFFLLFQAGELLDSKAEEDLARRVRELLAELEGS